MVGGREALVAEADIVPAIAFKELDDCFPFTTLTSCRSSSQLESSLKMAGDLGW